MPKINAASTAKPPTAPPTIAPIFVELDCNAGAADVAAEVLDGDEVELALELVTAPPPRAKLLLYACKYGTDCPLSNNLAPTRYLAGQPEDWHGLLLQHP
ncbi:hypothetical protein DOTSEDRAFT_45670 [Dothistroma septosporum NZE10]|uniref:Uncharacterized protein n=1 Tax=Dothistroma septosporum (strain NZE10 / CBS 128990) TaxID=675120 RepID=N1PLC8_DOTSN|nr:hypothetical protein DOTSEDRAFT_45670 [Dothistroma septosporum NZE10]